MNKRSPEHTDDPNRPFHHAVPEGLQKVTADAVLLPPAAVAADIGMSSTSESPTVPKMRAGLVWVLVFLTFGASMAVVTPIAFSLTVKIDVLAPGQVDILGYVTGLGALASVIATPLVGVLSDRTRTRWGRRRPWVLGGAVVGLAGLLGLALAPSVPVLIVSWIIALVGWQTATNMVISYLGDTLPEAQRGRVSAFNGFANMIAPIFGIALVSAVASDLVLLFLVPGLIAALGVVLFIIFAKEEPAAAVARTTLGQTLALMVFNPRKAPDYAWNWLGRALLFFGLSFTTTYGTYYTAARLDLPIVEVGGIVAVIGVGGIVFGALGAIGVGFLSDRTGRRKIFVLLAGLISLTGTLVQAFSYDLPGIIIGSMLGTLAIGAFSTVDQAIVLDVIPDRAESGRYIGIMQLAQQLPSTVGPLVAAGILTIGAVACPNYTLLYIASGAFALLGALVILFRVRGVR